jgi:hypothetical protein
MKVILKCTSPECSSDDIEWALISLDASSLERALARRHIFLYAQAQDDQLYEMYWWDNSPDYFALYPDPDTGHPLDEDESLEDVLRDYTGQPIHHLARAWGFSFSELGITMCYGASRLAQRVDTPVTTRKLEDIWLRRK